MLVQGSLHNGVTASGRPGQGQNVSETSLGRRNREERAQRCVIKDGS